LSTTGLVKLIFLQISLFYSVALCVTSLQWDLEMISSNATAATTLTPRFLSTLKFSNSFTAELPGKAEFFM
jgi:hypothetical protein